MTPAQFLSLLGGVGLFLFGMTIMSTGIKNSCGDKLQVILEKATANKYVAVFVGLALTMIIQSSSATDVMVIGFVNSGLMNLAQAIGVIMGANIGTTVTAQITAFNISTFTPLLLFAGAIMYLFFKKNIVRHIGSVIMGFGMLFEGVSIMKVAIKPLSETQFFIDFMTTLKNPAIAFIFGVIFTSIMQSSSSAIVIFQAFCVQGLIGFDVAIYLIIGAAIGSVTPNILASLTANRNGKRTAIINLLFNLIRAAIIITLINIFPGILTFIKGLSPSDVGRQIANAHTIFAISAVLIELPFTKQIIAISYKLIPVQETEKKAAEERTLQYMNQMDNIPAPMAIKNAQLEIERMGHIALDNFIEAFEVFQEYDEDKVEEVLSREETVDILNHSISDSMTHLRTLDLSGDNLRRVSMMAITLTDIERISDYAVNLTEYAQSLRSKKLKFSKKAMKELESMAENSQNAIAMALDIFASEDYTDIDELEKLESKVDKQQDKFINNHMERMMKKDCDPVTGMIFSDVVTDLERSSDHAINIAYALKERIE
ncbi:MAG: Na/Pi cotransporter family protein [Lachnospiraceae bacterium]|nr:Na/Pi cotransporter family protein [Lachnospiraceae bacterium]